MLLLLLMLLSASDKLFDFNKWWRMTKSEIQKLVIKKLNKALF
jgi:hypothetical protein